MAPIFAAAPDSTASPASVPQPDTAVATPAPAQAGHQTSVPVAPTGLESAAPVAPAPAPARESAAQPAASAASPASVPPWEDSPSPASATFAPAPSDAPPPAEAFSDELVAAQDDGPPPYDDGPPTWVDEDIPYDADAYTPDPEDDFETLAVAGAASEPREARAPAAAPRAARKPKGTPTARLSDMSAASWPQLAARLPVTGLAAELAKQSEWLGVQGDAVVLRVAVKTLAESESRVRLQTVLCEHFGQGLRLEIEVGATGDGTAHAVAKIERAARQQAAEEAVQADPFVQALISRFGAHVVPGSVRPFDATRLH